MRARDNSNSSKDNSKGTATIEYTTLNKSNNRFLSRDKRVIDGFCVCIGCVRACASLDSQALLLETLLELISGNAYKQRSKMSLQSGRNISHISLLPLLLLLVRPSAVARARKMDGLRTLSLAHSDLPFTC